jgi:hypothetical protein
MWIVLHVHQTNSQHSHKFLHNTWRMLYPQYHRLELVHICEILGCWIHRVFRDVTPFWLENIYRHFGRVEIRGVTVCWGTRLQGGRLRVSSPVVSLTKHFRPHYGIGFDKASNRNEHRSVSSGAKDGRCIGLKMSSHSCADRLEILGVSNNWGPPKRSVHARIGISFYVEHNISTSRITQSKKIDCLVLFWRGKQQNSQKLW